MTVAQVCISNGIWLRFTKSEDIIWTWWSQLKFTFSFFSQNKLRFNGFTRYPFPRCVPLMVRFTSADLRRRQRWRIADGDVACGAGGDMSVSVDWIIISLGQLAQYMILFGKNGSVSTGQVMYGNYCEALIANFDFLTHTQSWVIRPLFSN